ncbi:hypothetical protein GCM10023257_33680 [Streptomyces hyderabadensis]|uniref:Uncharacterized protein n=1 Tax=Streptomyces hyderabadensis TaxID=598549 RepID=A0ABP9I7N0_9ACTN
MARRILSAVSGATRCGVFRCFDTVPTETPARSATSLMLTNSAHLPVIRALHHFRAHLQARPANATDDTFH